MKQFSKVTYKTNKGKVFRTIAPVEQASALFYMNANYAQEIEVLNIKPSVKKGYKKCCNILVKTKK